MKYGRFDQNGRVFYGIVEGDQVVELDGSPFTTYTTTSTKHASILVKTSVFH